jgi:beta-lactam-binding protein with PASTA domain/tRNA A-37 threonylcarbamoyl transferase component Bud32
MTEQVGRVLGGRYRLLAPIGRGASAQVFVADDVRLERQVAVKVLHEALADDQVFLRRFQAEAQAAAALNHPNVMAVYDWGNDDEVPWIVMEFLGGGSLRGLLDRGHRLTPSQALVVALQAARGLDYAHRRGFVHRDIKPANLLFGDEGRLRIADFGLARALAEAAWTEPVGAVVGTARYASPEQAQGLSLTGRADVYSLALVVVEAVTGEVPFAADTTLGTLMARVGKEMGPLPALGPLADVLVDAAAPDPGDRLDGRELAAALAAVAPSLPRPAGLPLAGALDVDLSDDRDPTTLAGGSAASETPEDDELDVPAFVLPGNGSEPPAEPDLVGAAEVLGSFAAEGIEEELGDGDDEDPEQFMAWAPEPASPADDTTRVGGMGWTGPVSGPAPDAVAHDDEIPYDGADEGWSADDWDPRSPTGRRRRRWPRVVLVVLLVAALGAAIGMLIADLTEAPPTSAVPAVNGLSRDAALDSLRAQGWEVDVEEIHEDGTEVGQVLRTRPGQGTQLAEGDPVTLIVSKGPTLVDLPEITRGMAQQEASDLLEFSALEPVFTSRFDEEVEAEHVIEVAGDPPARIAKGTEVEVVVSQGPEPRTVPDGLPGMAQDEAVAALEELGLVAEIQEEFSDDVEAGLVIGTDPGAGAEAARDSTVVVVVSKGPDLVTVPDVSAVGTLAEAVALLEAEGLVAGDVAGPAAGAPASTSPGAGEQVRRGSEVDITLRRRDPAGPGDDD